MEKTLNFKKRIALLENQNEKLKRSLKFYKNVIDSVQIQIHINKISHSGYSGVEWSNKSYYTNSVPYVNEQNSLFYDKNFFPNNKQISNLALSISRKTKVHSLIYRNQNHEGDKSWHHTTCAPFKFSKNGKLTHILCSTINLNEQLINTEAYVDMIRELNRLKHKIRLSKLSKTELVVIALLAEGKSEKEIARIQNRSINTIKTHLKNIREKLELRKNTELVTFACKVGIGKY